MAMSPNYSINKRAVTAAPPPSPPHKKLEGNSLSLLPITPAFAHFGALYAATHGSVQAESVWAYMPYGPFASAEDMRARYLQMGKGGDPLFYAVYHHADSAYAGIVSYLRIAPAAYSIEVGHIWHSVARQRSHANTEAISLLAHNCFGLGYRRLEWKCDAANGKSRAAALRLGFAFEGVFRQHCVFKGKNRDTAWFAILDGDWQAGIAANYQAWLDSRGDNGKSSSSLADLNRPYVAWSLPAHNAWRVE